MTGEPPMPIRPSRRELISHGALGAAALALPATVWGKRNDVTPGLKIGVVAPWNPTPADIAFCQNLGIDTIYANYTPGPADPPVPTVEALVTRRKLWADAGIHLHNVRWFSGGPAIGSKDLTTILLDRPGRDEAMERCKSFVRNYGAAGFGYTIATVSITGVWYSGWGHAGDPPALTRGTVTRLFDGTRPEALRSTAGPTIGADTLMYGRRYGEDEMLANYRRFCDELRPILEDSGVFIGLHPDDPPAYRSFGGVARINGTFSQMQRNLDIANSKNIGITFCLGVWLEGGRQMGITDPVEAFRRFHAADKVFSINFRNVSGTLPRFTETYMDNGYYDMYRFMKALVQARYDGFLEQDHTLIVDGTQRAYSAFCAGYERALYQRAERELRHGRGFAE